MSGPDPPGKYPSEGYSRRPTDDQEASDDRIPRSMTVAELTVTLNPSMVRHRVTEVPKDHGV